MNIPDDLRYSAEHEWVRVDGARVRVGITDYAQDALGDIVYVELPTVGTAVEPGGPLGEVESTKSVSEIYAPVAGTVTAGREGADQCRDYQYPCGWSPHGRTSAAPPDLSPSSADESAAAPAASRPV